MHDSKIRVMRLVSFLAKECVCLNKHGLGQDTRPRTYFPVVFIFVNLLDKKRMLFDLKLELAGMVVLCIRGMKGLRLLLPLTKENEHGN